MCSVWPRGGSLEAFYLLLQCRASLLGRGPDAFVIDLIQELPNRAHGFLCVRLRLLKMFHISKVFLGSRKRRKGEAELDLRRHKLLQQRLRLCTKLQLIGRHAG